MRSKGRSSTPSVRLASGLRRRNRANGGSLKPTLKPRARRDNAMIAMPIGCRLRRAALLALRLESIHIRDDHWVIADLVSKAQHVRTVPIPTWRRTLSMNGPSLRMITHDAPVPRDQQSRARVGRRDVRRCSGMSSERPRTAPTSTRWHRKIFGARGRDSVMWPAANSIRFSPPRNSANTILV